MPSTTAAQAVKNLCVVVWDNGIYQITGGLAANKNEKLIAHVLHTVEITGDVTDAGGIYDDFEPPRSESVGAAPARRDSLHLDVAPPPIRKDNSLVLNKYFNRCATF